MMDQINGNETDPQLNDNSQQSSGVSEDWDENQMQKTLNFGRKKLFGRRSQTDSSDGSLKGTETQSQPKQRSTNRWPNITSSLSSSQLNTNSNNSNVNQNTVNNHKSNGFTTTTTNTTDPLNEDKFFGDGIQFGAKLIGHEFVAEARGEHMCQQSIKKLKILQRGLGGHKRKVLIFISFDGIKIRDAQTSELIYHHSVPQISFISRDETDSRAFGYVFGSSSTGHQFIALKTQKEAMPIMSTIGQLFAATLKRKKSEIIGESIASSAVNEEKSRRESSATLRPSRSESPNVPSMPAPPPPLLTKSNTSSAAPAEEVDFFTAFEPMDSVFESDFKVNKEKLEQMPITGGGGLDPDPFASSFGSLSLSSGDWANFDEDNLSASASSLQLPHNNTNAVNSNTTTGAFVISVPNANCFAPKAQISSSFNDSSSSMALNQLFNTSGHQLSNSSNFSPNVVNSEAVAIPPRPVDRNNSQSFGPLTSASSTCSSTDRYACFAEIHSISSSIFDSLCDQLAVDSECQSSNTSKSLNSSLNGGFGAAALQQQLSSSLKSTGNSFYYSFDNPLNSEQQKQNFFSQTTNNSQKFDTNFTQNTEINAQNVWNNNSFNTNYSQNVWSTSSSMSGRSSQVSGTSSPNPPSMAAPTPPPQNPMSATGFGINRSNDMLSEVKTVFAELDPLGKDRPFVDKTQFFADQKQKPTLRSLNDPIVGRSVGSDSPTTYGQTIDPIVNQMPSNVSSVPRRSQSSNANPFSAVSNELETRLSPNPFNPFFNSTCAVSQTPPPLPLTGPPLTPTPPPRPPSRDCPPIPPRNDLIRAAPPPTPPKPPTPDNAPPLPRRRTILPEHRYQSFETMSRQNCDPFSTTSQLNNSFIYNNPNTDDSFAPPLPNPQRKVAINAVPQQPMPAPQPMARKLSQNWDPFNCAFIDNQFSTILTTNTTNNQMFTDLMKNNFSDIESTSTSTPKQSAGDPVPNVRHNELRLSEIKSKYEWIAESVDKQSDSSVSSTTPADSSGTSATHSSQGFGADFSQFSLEQIIADKPEMRLDLNFDNNIEINGKTEQNVEKVFFNNSVERDVREDHISPPERNIFIPKADPFADEFFTD